ncbi:MAG: hypothetical protein ACJ8CR_22625 [Roseiflexaceae bacterium]
MLKGIHLTLLIGPAVPVPAPQFVIDALTSVQVNHDKERSGFQLSFTVGKDSPLVTTMLPAGYLDDPEQFWRICDANRAMRPDELTETVGRRLRITLPEGIPGMPNA